jgi:hypothetical protein
LHAFVRQITVHNLGDFKRCFVIPEFAVADRSKVAKVSAIWEANPIRKLAEVYTVYGALKGKMAIQIPEENYLFGGVGLNLPTVTEVSVSGFVAHTEGDPFLSNSIGIDFDGGVSVLGGSAAGYLNTSSLTSCLGH